MNLTAHELAQAVARQWIGRRQAQQLKLGTAKHNELQLEFFVGAAAAAQALDVPFNHNVFMLLAVGRDASMLLPKPEATPAQTEQRS